MDDNQIDLKRFKRHERKVPWALIRKIIIAFVMLGLLIYINKTLTNKTGHESSSDTEIELDIIE